MSKLSLKTEQIRVLTGDEMDNVDGGAGFAHPTSTAVTTFQKVSSALKPTATAVTTFQKISSAIKPTATAVTVFKKLSSAMPRLK